MHKKLTLILLHARHEEKLEVPMVSWSADSGRTIAYSGEMLCHDIIRKIANLVAYPFEFPHDFGFRPCGERRVVEIPMNGPHGAGKYGAALPGIVTDRDHQAEVKVHERIDMF